MADEHEPTFPVLLASLLREEIKSREDMVADLHNGIAEDQRRIQDHNQRIEEYRARLASVAEKATLSESDVLYSSHARCPHCKAGLAYPTLGRPTEWVCSAILLGKVVDDGKHQILPFAFYEVKSENQPSAQGATTRPKPETPTDGK